LRRVGGVDGGVRNEEGGVDGGEDGGEMEEEEETETEREMFVGNRENLSEKQKTLLPRKKEHQRRNWNEKCC